MSLENLSVDRRGDKIVEIKMNEDLVVRETNIKTCIKTNN